MSGSRERQADRQDYGSCRLANFIKKTKHEWYYVTVFYLACIPDMKLTHAIHISVVASLVHA